MKLLITIVQAYDADRLLRALTDAGFGATKINSVGGFLRMANATMLLAMEDDQVPAAIDLIRLNACRRVEVKMDASGAEFSEWLAAGFHEVQIGGAVVFSMPLQALYRVWPTHIDRQLVTLA